MDKEEIKKGKIECFNIDRPDQLCFFSFSVRLSGDVSHT